MKQITWLLSSVVILWSCNSSVKGDWSDSDMKTCIEDGKTELKEDSELKNMISMFTDNESEFINCACEQMEKDFDSYADADKAVENDLIAEEEGMKMFEACFGDKYREVMEMMEDME
jgi:endonuclease I